MCVPPFFRRGPRGQPGRAHWQAENSPRTVIVQKISTRTHNVSTLPFTRSHGRLSDTCRYSFQNEAANCLPGLQSFYNEIWCPILYVSVYDVIFQMGTDQLSHGIFPDFILPFYTSIRKLTTQRTWLPMVKPITIHVLWLRSPPLFRCS